LAGADERSVILCILDGCGGSRFVRPPYVPQFNAKTGMPLPDGSLPDEYLEFDSQLNAGNRFAIYPTNSFCPPIVSTCMMRPGCAQLQVPSMALLLSHFSTCVSPSAVASVSASRKELQGQNACSA
jgi:hypothetical protein